jgi:6-pyruvoyltetrahydropterin/6-carboxytetrahydropterin synthase
MSEMIIYKEFEFDAAHCLTRVPDGHKCGTLHGHTFKVIVYLKGDPDPDLGWILDFSSIRERVEPVLDRLDHTVLNDVDGLGNPTSENLCLWLWEKLKPEIEPLYQIEVKENNTSGCLYRGS